ncbi:MAG: patatin-like phospholipase family protein [Mucilaginibacter polytrichastri]|nr:patatin-like phospholipase family protein [Mucilaginibacter polytrichastri]
MKRACFTLLFLLCTICSSAQQVYKNLVFEGAGVRGIAYAGVLKELEKADILPRIEKVGGTSAGAIIALAVSLGYTSEEIYTLIGDTQFGKFNDGRYFFVGGFRRLSKKYGWYRGEKFERWLNEIIRVKTADGDITFRQLRERGFRDLYVTGTSLNRQRLLVFSAETYPDMKIRDAVRISMSVPLYFEAKSIDSAGHVVPGKKNDPTLDVVVDGGITGNFPIWLFDGEPNDPGKSARIANPQTIGVRIDSDPQIEKDRTSRELAPVPIRNLRTYVNAFYSYVLENLNRNQLNDDDWKRTISVSSQEISPKVKRLSIQEKEKLIRGGEESTARFLRESLAGT